MAARDTVLGKLPGKIGNKRFNVTSSIPGDPHIEAER